MEEQEKKPMDGLGRRAKTFQGRVVRLTPRSKRPESEHPAGAVEETRSVPGKSAEAWLESVLSEKQRGPHPEDGIVIDGSTSPDTSDTDASPIRFLPRIVVALRHRVLLAACLAGALVLTATVLLSTRFARLTVVVEPRREKLAIENLGFVAAASADAAPEAGQPVVPAEALEFTHSVVRDFEATGKKFVAEPSRGRVQIHNAFSSASQALVSRTRFVTDNGAVYRLTQGITIPGAEIREGKIVPRFIEAELVADEPGEQTNVSGEARLRIVGFKGTPRYDGFFAVAPSGFQGGTKGERIVASAEDVKRAQEQATKQAFDELREKMASGIPSGLSVPDGMREIEITEVKAPPSNTPGERFSVEARSRGRALAFRQSDVLEVIRMTLLDTETAKTIVEGSADLGYFVQEFGVEKKRARLSASGTVVTERAFSPEALAGTLGGKKEGSLIEILKQREEFSKFRLAFFPPWLFRAPADPAKIRVVVEEK